MSAHETAVAPAIPAAAADAPANPAAGALARLLPLVALIAVGAVLVPPLLVASAALVGVVFSLLLGPRRVRMGFRLPADVRAAPLADESPVPAEVAARLDVEDGGLRRAGFTPLGRVTGEPFTGDRSWWSVHAGPDAGMLALVRVGREEPGRGVPCIVTLVTALADGQVLETTTEPLPMLGRGTAPACLQLPHLRDPASLLEAHRRQRTQFVEAGATPSTEAPASAVEAVRAAAARVHTRLLASGGFVRDGDGAALWPTPAGARRLAAWHLPPGRWLNRVRIRLRAAASLRALGMQAEGASPWGGLVLAGAAGGTGVAVLLGAYALQAGGALSASLGLVCAWAFRMGRGQALETRLAAGAMLAAGAVSTAAAALLPPVIPHPLAADVVASAAVLAAAGHLLLRAARPLVRRAVA